MNKTLVVVASVIWYLFVSFLIMSIWNDTISTLFQLSKISYGGAIGILIFCRLLFAGDWDLIVETVNDSENNKNDSKVNHYDVEI